MSIKRQSELPPPPEGAKKRKKTTPDWQTIQQWLSAVPPLAREHVESMTICEMDSCSGDMGADSLCWDGEDVRAQCHYCVDNYDAAGDCLSCQLRCLEGVGYISFGEWDEKESDKYGEKVVCSPCLQLIREWKEKKFDSKDFTEERLRERKEHDLQPSIEEIVDELKQELVKRVGAVIKAVPSAEKLSDVDDARVIALALPALKKVQKRLLGKFYGEAGV